MTVSEPARSTCIHCEQPGFIPGLLCVFGGYYDLWLHEIGEDGCHLGVATPQPEDTK